jgi:phytoene synthase
MVNVTVTAIEDPERALALSYAPRDRRAALAALFALDAALGQVLRTTREPMVGQMRLAWWREALTRLDSTPPPGEPVLQALASEVLPFGVNGKRLSWIVDGWEELLRTPIDVFAMQRHAVSRGARLFEMAAAICEWPDMRRVERIGRGWAFADLAVNLSDPSLVRTASSMAAIRLPWLRPRWVREPTWPGPLRALSALALIERMNLEGRQGARRVARLAWHRLTGR